MARILASTKLRLNQLRSLQQFSKTFSTSGTTATQTKKPANDEEDPINNEPIKFFGSQAGSWRAKSTRSGGADEALWYQPYVISASVAIFLIYFCVLREENDIDLQLGKTLFERIDGLEEKQLLITYKYNRDNGLDNSQVVARLKELNIDVKAIIT